MHSKLHLVSIVDLESAKQMAATVKQSVCMQVSGKGDDQAPDSTAALADPLRFGPKPDQLIPKLPQDSEAAEGGVYRPPRLNPVSMDNDPDKDYGKKERRRQQHAARKAGRSEYVQALASELEGAPEEVNFSCLLLLDR